MPDPPTATAAAPPLSLCVINYQGARYLETTLASVEAQAPRAAEVLLVDDASRDTSLTLVRERHPAVRIVSLPQNLGPAAARNAGYRAARSDRILFLDNDVRLEPRCGARLSEALDRDADAVLAMPRILWEEDARRVQCDGADAHYLGLMSLHHRDAPAVESVPGTRRIGSLVTACFLIDRGRWGPEDPFDEAFFIFLEDHDLGLRARLAGHAIVARADALCWHRGGTEGLSVRRGDRYPPARIVHLIRNRWLILLQDYELRTLLAVSPMLLLFEVLQLAGVAARGWMPHWIEAARWVLGNRSAIAGRRRRVQATRKVGDPELLEGGPVPIRDELVEGAPARLARRMLDALAAGYWRLARRLL